MVKLFSPSVWGFKIKCHSSKTIFTSEIKCHACVNADYRMLGKGFKNTSSHIYKFKTFVSNYTKTDKYLMTYNWFKMSFELKIPSLLVNS